MRDAFFYIHAYIRASILCPGHLFVLSVFTLVAPASPEHHKSSGLLLVEGRHHMNLLFQCCNWYWWDF